MPPIGEANAGLGQLRLISAHVSPWYPITRLGRTYEPEFATLPLSPDRIWSARLALEIDKIQVVMAGFGLTSLDGTDDQPAIRNIDSFSRQLPGNG